MWGSISCLQTGHPPGRPMLTVCACAAASCAPSRKRLILQSARPRRTVSTARAATASLPPMRSYRVAGTACMHGHTSAGHGRHHGMLRCAARR